MEPLSWVSQYPSGIMVIDDEGNVSVPPSNKHQTAGKTAKSRVLDLINVGSTHKLKPLKVEAFQNYEDEGQMIFVITIALLLALAFLTYKNKNRLVMGFLLLGVSVLLQKLKKYLL